MPCLAFSSRVVSLRIGVHLEMTSICALEKRINAVLTMLEKQKTHPDLILLEFAVNE